VGFKIAPLLQLAEIAVGFCTFRFFSHFSALIFLLLSCQIGYNRLVLRVHGGPRGQKKQKKENAT